MSTESDQNHVVIDAPEVIRMEMMAVAPVFLTLALAVAIPVVLYGTGTLNATDITSYFVSGGVTAVFGVAIVMLFVRFSNRAVRAKHEKLKERINSTMQSTFGVTIADRMNFGDVQRVAAVDSAGNVSLWAMKTRLKTVEFSKVELTA